MVTIVGKVAKGVQAASHTVKLQLPHLLVHVPEIGVCHPGTINVQLAAALHFKKPDHTSEPIAWHPGYPNFTEVFSFLRILLEIPPGAAPIPAWIYIPHTSPHRTNWFIAEILAPKIEALAYEMDCRLHIESEHADFSCVVIQ